MGYLDYLQQQQDQASKNQQFWNDWYSKFQQASPTAQTATSAPGFNQAAQNTQQATQNEASAGGPNSFNANALRTNLARNAGNLTRSTDLNSFMQDFNENKNIQQQIGGSDLQRMNQIGNADNKLALLPQERYQNQLKNEYDINKMWENYYQTQNPIGGILGSGVGSAAGALASSLAKEKENSQGNNNISASTQDNSDQNTMTPNEEDLVKQMSLQSNGWF